MPQLTQTFTASKAVVPKIWVATQTRVAKGQKIGLAEAMQNWIVYFPRRFLASATLQLIGTWEKRIFLTLKSNLAAYCQ